MVQKKTYVSSSKNHKIETNAKIDTYKTFYSLEKVHNHTRTQTHSHTHTHTRLRFGFIVASLHRCVCGDSFHHQIVPVIVWKEDITRFL